MSSRTGTSSRTPSTPSSRTPSTPSSRTPSHYEGKKKELSKGTRFDQDLALIAEEIFQAYPRKVGKKAAEKAIVKALKDVDADFLISRVRAFADLVKRKKTEEHFIPHPSTWFNAGRWDDEELVGITAKEEMKEKVADHWILKNLEILVGHRIEELRLDKVTRTDVEDLASMMPESEIKGEQAEEFYRLNLPGSRFHRPGWIAWKSKRPELLLEG